MSNETSNVTSQVEIDESSIHNDADETESPVKEDSGLTDNFKTTDLYKGDEIKVSIDETLAGDVNTTITYNDNKQKALIDMDKNSEVDIEDSSKDMKAAIQFAITTPDDARDKRFAIHIDDGAQELTYGNVGINIKHRATAKVSNIEGTSTARLRALSAMGLIGRISIPLVNSGFWITLEAIGDKELLELEYRFSRNDVKLGRETNGAIYSNDSIIYDEIVLDFIKSKVIFSSLDVSLDKVCDYIVSEDIDALVTALAYALYPTGFDLHRACDNLMVMVDNKPKCTSILEFKVNPALMLWNIRERFTLSQVRLLSEVAPNKLTLNDIEEYNREKLDNCEKSFKLVLPNETVTVNLKDAMLTDKVKVGLEWLDMVESDTIDILGSETDEAEIADKLNKHAKISRLNTYIHYVESIVYEDGVEVTCKRLPELIETLTSFSSLNEDIILTFAENISKFIKSKRMNTFGLPEYECSDCKLLNSNPDADDLVKDLIPMDPYKVFFQLVTAKRELLLTKNTF